MNNKSSRVMSVRKKLRKIYSLEAKDLEEKSFRKGKKEKIGE